MQRTTAELGTEQETTAELGIEQKLHLVPEYHATLRHRHARSPSHCSAWCCYHTR